MGIAVGTFVGLHVGNAVIEGAKDVVGMDDTVGGTDGNKLILGAGDLDGLDVLHDNPTSNV